MTSVLQASLAGGELSPAHHGRSDLARYQNSLAKCLNALVDAYGGVMNRSGFRYCTTVKDSTKRVRILPFEFNASQTYVLEFGDYYMRVLKDGAPVLVSSVPIDWAAGVKYGIGARVKFGTDWYVSTTSHVSAATFILDFYNWLPLSSTEVYELVTPYSASDISKIRIRQSADVVTIAHPAFPPQRLTRKNHDAWTIEDFPFVNGPFEPINIDKTKTVYTNKVTGGGITVTASVPNFFTADKKGQLLYIEQRNFGLPWVAGETGLTAGTTVRRSDGKHYLAVAGTVAGTVTPTHDEGTYNDGKVDWLYLHSGFGHCRITDVAPDGKTATADVIEGQQLPDNSLVSSAGSVKNITGTASTGSPGSLLKLTITGHTLSGSVFANVDLVYTDIGVIKVISGNHKCSVVDADHVTVDDVVALNPIFGSNGQFVYTSGSSSNTTGTYKWAWSAWNDTKGYPSTVNYFQQRLCFGGTATSPNTVWTSKTSNFVNFGTSRPIVDDDALTFDLASNKVDQIRSLLSLDKLIMLTAGSEWALSGGGNSDALTPGNILMKPQGFRGASDALEPLVIGESALFLQNKGQVVRSLDFELSKDKFIGSDLTVMANHLVAGKQITAWTYQQCPKTIAWMVRSDGALLGLTYLAEQQVVAWHQHNTDGTFEDICSVSGVLEDDVYVVVKRGNLRTIEKLETRYFERVEDCFFVDSGLSYDGRLDPATGAAWAQTMTVSAGGLVGADSDLDSSAAVFSSADIGSQIVFDTADGMKKFTVTVFNHSQSVTGNFESNFPLDQVGIPQTGWAKGAKTVSGLGHLEGKTVSCLVDGNVERGNVVASGKVVLQNPGVIVHAGLPYNTDIETLDLNLNTPETPRDKYKNIPAVRLMVKESRGVFAGPDANHLFEFKQRADEAYDQPVGLFTGLAEIRILSTWNKTGRVFIRQSDPLPLTILAVIPEVSIGGA